MEYLVLVRGAMNEKVAKGLKSTAKILVIAAILLFFGKDMLFDIWHNSNGYGAKEYSSGKKSSDPKKPLFFFSYKGITALESIPPKTLTRKT